MAVEMVMAYGDDGLEPSPVEDVIEIECAPQTGGYSTPGLVRWLAKRGGHVPTRIRRIRRPGTRLNPTAFAYVEFDCTPFVRYVGESGPVYGHWSGCYVRNASEATDPLFSSLPAKSRARIVAAVEA